MKVIKVNPWGCGGPMILSLSEKGLLGFMEELREDENGAKWTVEVSEMSDEEFKNLPEHPGW